MDSQGPADEPAHDETDLKLKDALQLAGGGDLNRGYVVTFEERDGRFLRSDQFPERPSEPPFATIEAAIGAAKIFAAFAPARYVNIWVREAGSYRAVDGVEVLRKYPENWPSPDPDQAMPSKRIIVLDGVWP